MTQISKRPISKELSQRMQELLWDSVVKLNNKNDVSAFFEDILTQTEKTMIAKRLATALLISRGWDQEAIDHYIKVSLGTIHNIKNKLNSQVKGYQKVITQIEKSREWEQMKLDLSQALEEIIAERVVVGRRVTKPAIREKYRQKREKYKVL